MDTAVSVSAYFGACDFELKNQRKGAVGREGGREGEKKITCTCVYQEIMVRGEGFFIFAVMLHSTGSIEIQCSSIPIAYN